MFPLFVFLFMYIYTYKHTHKDYLLIFIINYNYNIGIERHVFKLHISRIAIIIALLLLCYSRHCIANKVHFQDYIYYYYIAITYFYLY